MSAELIEIANIRNLSSKLGYIDIFVDRRSVLGNPFNLTKEADRDKVCDAYDEWLGANLSSYYKDMFCEEKVDLTVWIDRGLQIAPKFKEPTVRQVGKEIWRHVWLLLGNKRLFYKCWCKQPDKEVRCHADSIKKNVLGVYKRIVNADYVGKWR